MRTEGHLITPRPGVRPLQAGFSTRPRGWSRTDQPDGTPDGTLDRRSTMRKRVAVAAAGAGAALAVAAGGVAVATGGDDGAASHQYTKQQAEAATRAALTATG